MISLVRKNFSSSSPFDDALGEFRPIDRDRLVSELDLMRKAKQNGLDNLPAANETAKDAFTVELEAKMHSHLERTLSDLISRLHAMDEMDEQQSSLANAQNVNATFRAAVAELETIQPAAKSELVELRKKVVSTSDELNNFRQKNNLIGSAKHPETRVQGWVLAVVIFLIELVATIFFLGDVHPGSYSGVLIVAGSFTFVNFLVALALSFFFRYVFHNKIG